MKIVRALDGAYVLDTPESLGREEAVSFAKGCIPGFCDAPLGELRSAARYFLVFLLSAVAWVGVLWAYSTVH